MTLRPLYPLQRADALLAAGTALAGLALYTRTLAPDLLLGDSGEFQTLAYTLGMTHPTGYPVFVLAARLFTLLPLGGLAWRVNLFVAVQAALCLGAVALIIRLLAGWRIAAVAGAFVLAVTPLFWFHAVIAELYIPAAALTAGIILLLLLWRQTGRHGWLFAAGLLGGLSLGVHSTVALLAPAAAVYLLISGRLRPAWRPALGGALLGGLLAVGCFIALDLADAPSTYYNATVRHALSAWQLDGADFDNPFERLAFLYTGRQFRALMFRDPSGVMPAHAAALGGLLISGLSPLALGLGATGLAGLLARRWREGLLLLLGGGAQVLFALNYEVYDFTVFFIPAFIFMAAWAGVGLGLLLDAAGWLLIRVGAGPQTARAAAGTLGVLVLALAARPALPTLTEAWRDRQANFARGTDLDGYPYPISAPAAVHEQAAELVDAVEDDAIVFCGWDMLYPYYFVAHVEQGRTGMVFHETLPQEGMDRLAESTLAYISASLPRPVYFLERPRGADAARLAIKPINKSGTLLYQVVGIKP